MLYVVDLYKVCAMRISLIVSLQLNFQFVPSIYILLTANVKDLGPPHAKLNPYIFPLTHHCVYI